MQNVYFEAVLGYFNCKELSNTDVKKNLAVNGNRKIWSNRNLCKNFCKFQVFYNFSTVLFYVYCCFNCIFLQKSQKIVTSNFATSFGMFKGNFIKLLIMWRMGKGRISCNSALLMILISCKAQELFDFSDMRDFQNL